MQNKKQLLLLYYQYHQSPSNIMTNERAVIKFRFFKLQNSLCSMERMEMKNEKTIVVYAIFNVSQYTSSLNARIEIRSPCHSLLAQ